jgi:hypothetical protein
MARLLIADCSGPDFSAALAGAGAEGFGNGGDGWRGRGCGVAAIMAEPPDLLLVDSKSAAEIITKQRVPSQPGHAGQ